MGPSRITVLGSSNTDMIIQLPRIPRPGETVLGGRFTMAAGGKGANQAVAAARAGGRVQFIGRVGRDVFGDRSVAGLRQDGIDVSCILRDEKEASGTALIFVEDSGENCIAVAPGANGNMSRADVQTCAAAIEAAGILLMQLETPLDSVLAASEIAAKADVEVILNPAPAAALPDELLARTCIITPNETEAARLTGIEIRDDAALTSVARVLMDKGVGTVVITLGARGVFLATPAAHQFVPAFPVRPVDSTAAGDVFNGALAVALSEGSGLRAAAVFANAAAALSVTRLGAQPSIPSRAEIDSFLSRHGGSSGPLP